MHDPRHAAGIENGDAKATAVAAFEIGDRIRNGGVAGGRWPEARAHQYRESQQIAA